MDDRHGTPAQGTARTVSRPPQEARHVVVVGGGFGGLRVAQLVRDGSQAQHPDECSLYRRLRHGVVDLAPDHTDFARRHFMPAVFARRFEKVLAEASFRRRHVHSAKGRHAEHHGAEDNGDRSRA
jgi:hypothetical protein